MYLQGKKKRRYCQKMTFHLGIPFLDVNHWDLWDLWDFWDSHNNSPFFYLYHSVTSPFHFGVMPKRLLWTPAAQPTYCEYTSTKSVLRVTTV